MDDYDITVRFNYTNFLSRPGLASCRMSPFWMLLEQMMTEVLATTGAIRRAKFHQQTKHSAFYRPDALSVAQLTVTISLRFNGHFPREPGLAGVY